MIQTLLTRATETYSAFGALTSAKTTKQKVIQIVAIILAGNGTILVLQGRLVQSGINWMGGALLWVNQESFVHQALSENVGSLAAHIKALDNNMEERENQIKRMTSTIEVMETKNREMTSMIENMEAVYKGGKDVLHEQAAQLKELKSQRDELEKQVKELDCTRELIRQEVQALEKTRKDIEEAGARIKACMESLSSQHIPR